MTNSRNTTIVFPKVGKKAYLCGMKDKNEIGLSDENDPLTPYTMEEINAMINEAERDFEAGRYYTTEEVLKEIEEEIHKLRLEPK